MRVWAYATCPYCGHENSWQRLGLPRLARYSWDLAVLSLRGCPCAGCGRGLNRATCMGYPHEGGIEVEDWEQVRTEAIPHA